MAEAHLALGVAVIAANLLAGCWGGAAYLRGRASVPFWYMLRAAQLTVVAQVTFGAVLLLLGHQAQDELHYVYGALPVLVAFLAEGVRAGVGERELGSLDFEALPRQRRAEIALYVARREMGIMAASALVVFGLALRAAFVSGGL